MRSNSYNTAESFKKHKKSTRSSSSGSKHYVLADQNPPGFNFHDWKKDSNSTQRSKPKMNKKYFNSPTKKLYDLDDWNSNSVSKSQEKPRFNHTIRKRMQERKR